MAIYLDHQADEPKILIKLIEESNLAPWVKKALVGKVQDDINQKESYATCKHKKAAYTGKKTCCSKCGSFYKPGMGFEWTTTTTRRPKG